ncbi:aspartate aminotransferase family protein [Lutibaculum baratangense]|uniref:Adenosylmethionine-8-amino-7-oxononanoate aminotransferase n=1 Tax=Lutibaculum baratangense AMV1 TaxID=631454 RepID=V4RNM9_9HYPH|nr:aspartate aminotransferase family protein [Lutibaculum baratangense]ESR24810.1 Adenosylmethionine-8-amino-7-oxononanoate aminotransferase [Lutibaculum baratangense AMV1]
MTDRRSHVFYRDLKTEYPLAVAGEGVWIVDSEGRRYLDASGGAAVSCLGHCHPRIVKAIRDQAGKLEFAHTAFFTSEPAEELAERLVRAAPDGFTRVYFVSGGSEANEAALKLARQVHVERGESHRIYAISRLQSYHGNTIGALSLGGNPARRALFEPLLGLPVAHVDPCYAYRHQGAHESEEDYGVRAARSLEEKILELGPENVSCFFAETVVGATAGAVPPAPGYFREIRRICDRYGVLMVLDEVMCGMGRTGTLFACEQEDVVPDIITVAKGLGAGHQSIGAVLARFPLVDAIERNGVFQHGHTYIGHAIACAAALEVQRVIEDEGLLERVSEAGETFARRLESAFGQNPHVGDIRGRGYFRAIELVADRESKQPFPRKAGLAAKIKARAMAAGLVCYPGNGTADGEHGDHVLLAPPFIASDEELDTIVEFLAGAVEGALGEVAA